MTSLAQSLIDLANTPEQAAMIADARAYCGFGEVKFGVIKGNADFNQLCISKYGYGRWKIALQNVCLNELMATMAGKGKA